MNINELIDDAHDGFCILVLPRPLDDYWVIAPLRSSEEYVFRSWSAAHRYATEEFSDHDLEHLKWKIVPHKVL